MSHRYCYLRCLLPPLFQSIAILYFCSYSNHFNIYNIALNCDMVRKFVVKILNSPGLYDLQTQRPCILRCRDESDVYGSLREKCQTITSRPLVNNRLSRVLNISRRCSSHDTHFCQQLVF